MLEGFFLFFNSHNLCCLRVTGVSKRKWWKSEDTNMLTSQATDSTSLASSVVSNPPNFHFSSLLSSSTPFRVAQIVASWQRRCEKVEEERENGRKWRGRERDFLSQNVKIWHFLSQNVKIWYFLSRNVEIRYFLSQSVKIRYFLSQNLKIRSQRK